MYLEGKPLEFVYALADAMCPLLLEGPYHMQLPINLYPN